MVPSGREATPSTRIAGKVLAECYLRGTTGHLASLAIGDILLANLGRRLTRTDLLELLAEHSIQSLAAGSRQTAHKQVLVLTGSWSGSIQRELLQPRIARSEAAQLVEALDSNRLGLVAGTAGGGKSSVLEQAVALLESAGAEVLALRLDRLESFASTIDLGRQLGLDTSPAVALALAAEGRPAYLVVDQLDAVSLASGPMQRARRAERERSPVGLYVDEMHNYLALPRSFEDMLAEARGYGLGLVLAHQHMGLTEIPAR